MPRPRPPYLLREETRHKTVVWYVRKGDGPRTRIKGEYGSKEFMAAYHAAVAGEPAQTLKRSPSGSLEWLVARYRETGAWMKLSQATRKQRENIFRGVIEKSGNEPYALINRADIAAGCDRRAATPAQALCFLKAMRACFDGPTRPAWFPLIQRET